MASSMLFIRNYRKLSLEITKYYPALSNGRKSHLTVTMIAFKRFCKGVLKHFIPQAA